MNKTHLALIAPIEAVEAMPYLVVDILLKDKPCTALVFYWDGKAYSYVNDCMHMHRELNCGQDAIFDETGRLLRCSMHGFVFEPTTGECQSPVCFGERLQSLKLHLRDGNLYFAEKHLRVQAGGNHGND